MEVTSNIIDVICVIIQYSLRDYSLRLNVRQISEAAVDSDSPRDWPRWIWRDTEGIQWYHERKAYHSFMSSAKSRLSWRRQDGRIFHPMCEMQLSAASADRWVLSVDTGHMATWHAFSVHYNTLHTHEHYRCSSQWRNFKLCPLKSMFHGPLPYLGRAVVARRFLAPGVINHFGALFLLLPPFHSFRSSGLKVGPLNPAMGSRERCQLSQWGLGRSPSRKRFWCILRT